jgi:hypothetical protein
VRHQNGARHELERFAQRIGSAWRMSEIVIADLVHIARFAA